MSLKSMCVLLMLSAMAFAETEYLTYQIEEQDGNMMFKTKYWCLNDCYGFDRPIKVIVTNDTYQYCPDVHIMYEEGCAILANDTIIAKKHSPLNQWVTWRTIDEEFMHFYMWQEYGDVTHSEEFWRHLGYRQFDLNLTYWGYGQTDVWAKYWWSE